MPFSKFGNKWLIQRKKSNPCFRLGQWVQMRSKIFTTSFWFSLKKEFLPIRVVQTTKNPPQSLKLKNSIPVPSQIWYWHHPKLKSQRERTVKTSYKIRHFNESLPIIILFSKHLFFRKNWVNQHTPTLCNF